MQDFTPSFDWTLLHGFHRSVGRDGGTCVTEAAIVAAGFRYRAVRGLQDVPPCFSRVVTAYAINLNDAIPDDLRQSLRPYVLRLAGTAATPAIEKLRARHIAIQTINHVLPPLLRQRKCNKLEAAARQALSLDEVNSFAAIVVHMLESAGVDRQSVSYRTALAAARAAKLTSLVCSGSISSGKPFPDYAWKCAAAAVTVAQIAASAPQQGEVWENAVEILGDCIRMGKEPAPLDEAAAVARLNAAKPSNEPAPIWRLRKSA